MLHDRSNFPRLALPVRIEPHLRVSTTAEIVAVARAGRPFILVDRMDRENEGDLIVLAEFATPAVIAFMARECRGLVCLALHPDIAGPLGLKVVDRSTDSLRQTAFTQSIEAVSGITTGISAADRAATVAAALRPDGARHIASPGHVFPLIARAGGVCERDGHTEASVEVARLAGRRPAAVICEIMNDDGTMARRNDLAAFARRHGLAIGTVEDLVDHVRRERPGAIAQLNVRGG